MGTPTTQKSSLGGTFDAGIQVRSVNGIYHPLGVGRVQKVRDRQCKVEFNPTVFSRPPYRSENKILNLNEIEVCATPLEQARSERWDEAWKFDLRQMAARFLCLNKGGQLSNARTEILPHQIFTAYTVVSNPKRRFMLADEVGLGKTVEAGMVWQVLAQRGNAARTLVVCPAGLTRQWQEELEDKFHETFETFGRDFQAVNPRIWDLKATAIASLDRLKRKEHKRTLLENRKWDLIIFDEAQHLSARLYPTKVDKTQNYQLAEALRDYTDALLLLTATPHAGDPNHGRFINLVKLLETNVDFRPLVDDGLFHTKDGIPYSKLILRTPKLKVTDAQGQAVFKGRRTIPLDFRIYADEKKFYDAVEDYIRTGYNSLEQIEDPTHRRAIGFILTSFQKLNASSLRAIRAALELRLARLEQRLVQIPAEEEAEDADERYLGEQEEREALKSDRELLKDEIKVLKKLLAMPVAREKKIDRLRELLRQIDKENPGTKVLIFTEYRRTQEFLKERLEEWYGSGTVVLINGDMKLEGKTPEADSKRRSQQLFRDDPNVRFLVSTEAGGEGINLQFCHVLVNYDLPWNPMRYEQRVGRVYRYGQQKVVHIYNLKNRDTIEDTVRSYFDQRLRYAGEALSRVTGEDAEELVASLNGQLETEVDPEEIYKRALVEGTLNKQSKEEIKQAVERAQEAYRIATTSLFKDISSYSFDSYKRDLASPVGLKDLEQFTLNFLIRERRQIQRKDGFLEFLTPEVLQQDGLPERYRAATFDRQTAIRNPQSEFLAIGHPFVDAMIRHIGEYDFGGHTATRFIKAADSSLDAPVTGFQFNFTVRRRVAREDGDEHLFDWYTVVVRSNGEVDENLAVLAAKECSLTGYEPTDAVSAALGRLGSTELENAFALAKAYLEQRIQLWDWDEEVDLIGVAKLAFLPANM
ncbi:MAG TPA: helicase-related protein [Candidatus Acidoferrum sp.]|nr:helicase-related protein [Candidatus Acidoferrum sp.]